MTKFPLEINTPDYWDAVYEAEAKEGFARKYESLYNMILGHIRLEDSILDFGCGPGNFSKWLRKKRPKAKIKGIDYSEYAIKEAKNKCKENDYEVNDNISGGPYNVIVAMHVLEHFPNPDFYIEQAYNNLTDDGILIIVFPMYDQPWLEHLKIWTLDFLRLFMKQQKKWKWIIVHRPSTGYTYKSGEAIEEAIVFCQKA